MMRHKIITHKAPMSLPFDPSPVERRPYLVTFATDEDTGRWLEQQMEEHSLDRSLICHRIVKKAKDSTTDSPKRRVGDTA